MKYTKSNKGLSTQEREFYEENGFIIIKNNVSHELIDEIIERFINLCDGTTDRQKTYKINDRSLKARGLKGQYAVNKIQGLLHDDIFFKYASCPSVINIVESIIGPNINGVHSMLINKPPDSHSDLSRHPLHQDLHYFPFRPINGIVGSWTALEKVNELNGCLYVIPGSHKPEQLYKHEYPKGQKNEIYHGVSGFENEPSINLVMDKGDTVFFHPLLLHGSGINKTKGFRKAISVHFADSNSYFIDVKGTIQEEVQNEIDVHAGMHHLTFWKRYSRHIKGKIGSMNNFRSQL